MDLVSEERKTFSTFQTYQKRNVDRLLASLQDKVLERARRRRFGNEKVTIASEMTREQGSPGQ